MKYIKIYCIYNFYLLIFGCTGSLLLHRLFSSCAEQGRLASCGVRVSHCSGFSCCGAEAAGCTGLGSRSSWALEHRLNSCGTRAWCGIFPDQGSNPCLLHFQVDSLLLSHQGSPIYRFSLTDRGVMF